MFRATVVAVVVLAGIAQSSCDLSAIEGEDVAIFNNVNELVVVGRNTAGFRFDHMDVRMFVHLHRDSRFRDEPSARLSLKWFKVDDQGNHVALDETSRMFFDAATEGDFYARAFIDIDRDSELTDGEPWDVWADSYDSPKVVKIREESRWRLVFEFDRRYRAVRRESTPS